MPELKYQHSTIVYQEYGTGEHVVICFHGYGENAHSYKFLGALPSFRFVAIELPFHSYTSWNESSPPTTENFIEIVNLIVGKSDNESVSLMGFSLGARIALAVYERSDRHFQKLILLAPDGLKVNFWYWLATQTIPGRQLFKLTMKHPKWFFGMLAGMNKTGLVNASVFKFVHRYIDDESFRKQLLERWIGLRKIKPDLKRIADKIKQSNTSTRILYGKHDRIILSNRGKIFCRMAGNNCKVIMVDSGHQLLHAKHAKAIADALKD